MLKPFALLIALLLSGFARGQKDIPSYGKIDKADLDMTSCDFDPEADAEILINTGETTFNVSGEIWLETKYRFRIKILKDKGVEWADVKVPFYSHNRVDRIDNVSAETYNLDASGNIVKSKLEHANIYTKQVSKNWSQLSFTLPDVKKGSVIEYEYTKVSTDFGDIEPWDFQYPIPVRYTQFYLSIPSYFQFTANSHITLPIDRHDDEYAATWARTYTMKNIPGLRDEPYMSAPNDYLQRITFQFTGYQFPGEAPHTFNTTWASINQEFLDDEDFGGQLHKNVPHTADLDALLANLSDSTARMAAIYEYVRRHIDCNEEEGLFSQQGIKTAWDKKVGSVADINLLLVNLLRDARLDAHPLLVSTRDHGRVNIFSNQYEQFNKVMAYVYVGGHYYILNAADKYNPYRLIPYDVQYTKGFVIDKDNPGWVTLVDDKSKYRTVVIINGDVDSTGKLTGSASITNFDYSKNLRCKRLKEGLDKYKDTYFTKAYSNLSVDSLEVSGQDNDSLPLKQELDFNYTLNGSGQYLFLSPNLFTGLEKNPFVAEHRFTDVDFGYRQSYMVVGTISIPDGFTFETLPKNMRMIMQDTSIVLERLAQADDGRVSFRIGLEFKRPVYYLDEYDDFREFYKKLFATLNEQIVIKKKS